ncbi:phytanoyl-CoA dioxygenase family protein [Kordiimonas sp. SCSIO 12610]|uniref:phytanoyl-CoA dioxygenase family protein n=1 Tax=Kordiimonas sp. SCSIO 12610 TaxID=2829597 RepID=UPI00210B859A|nr:phytanoyl-CoA dioxygenase family protein [Kordiimonas sp. SCSIO 12610]UTW54883.1 phytanoyl-CoA dioxygenase family protein [Kordiimonas sp. SCSIO 12610]
MQIISKIYMLPIWFFGLFGQSKSFKANPIIGSRLLNILGLHILRVVLAHIAAHIRWFFLKPMMDEDEREAYHRDGFVLVPDFIDEETIQAITDKFDAMDVHPRQMVQGNTYTQRILLDDKVLQQSSPLSEVVNDSRLQDRLFYTGAKWHRPLMYIQRIRNGFVDGKKDPQKTMHSDTFHPTMKAWLFLQDVEQKHGPFTYVKGSHRLSLKRLKWEYRRSIQAGNISDGYSEKGSFRADAQDLEEMELAAPKGITVKAGTLVIANTNGFHGRGQANDGESRIEIWAYSRHNPFNILPGFGSKLMANIEQWGLQQFWLYKDRQAAKNISRASWHLIDADEMFLDNDGR